MIIYKMERVIHEIVTWPGSAGRMNEKDSNEKISLYCQPPKPGEAIVVFRPVCPGGPVHSCEASIR